VKLFYFKRVVLAINSALVTDSLKEELPNKIAFVGKQ